MFFNSQIKYCLVNKFFIAWFKNLVFLIWKGLLIKTWNSRCSSSMEIHLFCQYLEGNQTPLVVQSHKMRKDAVA